MTAPMPTVSASTMPATRSANLLTTVDRIETTTTRDALRTKEIVVLRRRRREKAKTLSVRLKQRGSKPPNQRRRRSGNHRPKQAVRRHLRRRRGSGDGQGVTTASGAFTSVVPPPVILCVMDTRFAHLNPDRRSPVMRRGSGSEDEGVQGNPQVVVAPESQRIERFGELTPERRLEELRAEMEKLSQVISGSARDSELASGRQDRCGGAAEEMLCVSRKRLRRSENREVRPRARVTC
ncbi:hypothetical protein HPB52_024842 [Rhipicephalus sanguineus]|uniref:Uncharacterized protein n=1 Tax=Rhipicephalus sanguineus TaxID=34632 RepID=A0A9D4TDV8_RHISA|nr:hypothetical protein HPB52_024842 [Rhipicephalus sanguineus]